MPEGDEPYVRTAIPPNGTELYSQPTAVRIVPAAVPRLKPVASPIGGPVLALHLIEDQTLEIDHGGFTGNLTIVNSTLLLGKEGQVPLGMGSLTIENSKLIDMGYGYSPGCDGGNHCDASLLIKNSTLDGAYLADLNYDNITIENSLITNSPGDRAVSTGSETKSVIIVNNTFSGTVSSINVGVEPSVSNKILVSGNKFYNIVEEAIIVGPSEPASITVADNVVIGNLATAIQVSGNAVVRGNMISDDKGCPLGLSGDNNAVFGNTVSDSSCNGVGIGGNGNIVYQNNFINDSAGTGIGGNGNIVYQNNFINDTINSQSPANNQLFYKGEGNYWSSYTGKDANFDGIGDTPYNAQGMTDSYPFMKPNGWLTKFYLTLDTNLPVSTAFQINGTSFSLGLEGTATLRLGYVAAYSLALPRTVKLANGTTLGFSRWGDEVTSPTRTLELSANSTLVATYVLEASTTTSSSSSSTTAITSSQAPTTLELALVGVVAVVLIVLGVIFFRRRHS